LAENSFKIDCDLQALAVGALKFVFDESLERLGFCAENVCDFCAALAVGWFAASPLAENAGGLGFCSRCGNA